MSTDTAYQSITSAQALANEQTDNPHYRMMPHNQEAEQGLLGALLVNNGAYDKISDLMKAEHFYLPVHQRIFTAVMQFIERGQTASPVTLKGYFEKDEDLTDLGGSAYLADLAGSIISVINVRDYAQTIYELFLRRQLINLGEDIVNDAHDQRLESSASETIEDAEARLFSLAETGETKGGFVSLRDSVMVSIEVAEKAFQTKGHVTGHTTGLRDMDKQLGGMHPSDLVILAGRPSMGKTALATNIAFNSARAYARTGGKEGARVGFFSLEMSADQLATRILADVANISGHAIKQGDIKQEDFQNFVKASQELSQVPLYIDDTPALTIGAVRTRSRRLKRQHGLDMLVIDYLQLLRGTGSRQAESNRVQEVAEITRGLKAIAKELHIPVLALSQLSRAVEQREDKRPMLSDLRESGSIEQDADVVMFVYREEYYLHRAEPEIGSEKHMQWQEACERALNIGECIVAKARHGPIGTVRMHFDGHLTRFSDLDEHHDSRGHQGRFMCALSGELVINLAAIRDNYAIIKNKVGSDCLIAPSVKANAYGLGADRVVPALYDAGARDFFVATLDEGRELRALKSDVNIYILNGYWPDAHTQYQQYALTPVLNSLAEIRAYGKHGGAAILHFNTGMNRLGIPANETDILLKEMDILSSIQIKAVMSHLVSSEESQNPLNTEQLNLFKQIATHFPDVPHSLCNSGGVFLSSDFHHDIVRPGIALYGGRPTDAQDENPMKAAVSLSVPVLQIHDVKEGETAGYNATHRFHKNGKVAIMSIGYADGVFRKISNVGSLYFKGQQLPIRGRVSMDLIICDLDGIDEENMPKPGDMAEVIGTHQSIDDVARDSETISYEILTALGHRYKRSYI